MISEKPSLEELSHHGVKGQRWGIRKKQDVSSEEQAKREAKAQKFVKRSEDLQRRIDTGNTNISILSNQQSQSIYTKVRVSQLKQDQRTLEKMQENVDKHAEAKRQGKLTPTQKKLLIGGAVIGGLVVAGVVAKKVDSGEFRQTVNRGREILTGKKFKFTEAPELKGNWSADAIEKLVVPDINPGYPNGIGTGMNCRRCTFAYEMRRRGLDVAATRTPTASGQNPVGLLNALTTDFEDISQKQGMKMFLTPNAKDPISRHLNYIGKGSGGLRKFKNPSPVEIFERLAKEPERSRGELGVFWKAGGGHSMAYEIINGEAHIFDAQTGKHYANWTDMNFDLPDMGTAGWTRLDNVPLDTNFLQRWVKNVK